MVMSVPAARRRRPPVLSSVVSGISVGFSGFFSLGGWRRAHHPVRQPALNIQILLGGLRCIAALELHNLSGAGTQSGFFVGFANLGDGELAEVALCTRLPPLAQVKVQRRFQRVQFTGVRAVIQAFLNAVDTVRRTESQQGVHLLC